MISVIFALSFETTQKTAAPLRFLAALPAVLEEEQKDSKIDTKTVYFV